MSGAVTNMHDPIGQAMQRRLRDSASRRRRLLGITSPATGRDHWQMVLDVLAGPPKRYEDPVTELNHHESADVSRPLPLNGAALLHRALGGNAGTINGAVHSRMDHAG